MVFIKQKQAKDKAVNPDRQGVLPNSFLGAMPARAVCGRACSNECQKENDQSAKRAATIIG